MNKRVFSKLDFVLNYSFDLLNLYLNFNLE